MDRINLNQYNSVLLVCQGNIGLYYEAFLRNNISQSTQLLLGDMPFKGIIDSYLMGLITNAHGYAPSLSYNRIATYKGTTPTTIKLDTVLKLKSDFNKDIIQPLNNLFQICLPSEGPTLKDAVDSVNIDQAVTAIKDSLAAFLGSVGIIGEYLQTGINSLSDMIQNIAEETATVKIPFMVNLAEANHMWCYVGAPDVTLSNKANIITGPWLITELSVELGKLVIEGGYPEVVNVGLTLESLRTQSTQSSFSMFKSAKKSFPQDPGDLFIDTEIQNQ